MLSLESIYVEGARVLGSRIGMCSNDVMLTYSSRIDANFKGCPPDDGKGNMPRKSNCSGAGGAHGGYGGAGSSSSTSGYYKDTCSDYKPLPYYFGKEARFEGSGGTSGDSTKTLSNGSGMKPGEHGGSGGGIVWITTPATL